MAYGVTVTTSTATASATIEATGGVPTDTYYVMRRDASGVHVIRDAAEGLVWPGSGPLSVVDYEATQAGTVDYLLTDVDGALLAAATGVSIPSWGTWLKAPTLPQRNVRVYLAAVGPTTRRAAREVYEVEGSDVDVVLTGVRSAAGGALAVTTLDDDAAAAVRSLLADGATVLIDAHPGWAVPYRYVSVGDVVESRPAADDDSLGLDDAARMFLLSDVVPVDAPIGTTTVAAGWTYEVVPTLFGSYAAIAASFDSYDEFAAG